MRQGAPALRCQRWRPVGGWRPRGGARQPPGAQRARREGRNPPGARRRAAPCSPPWRDHQERDRGWPLHHLQGGAPPGPPAAQGQKQHREGAQGVRRTHQGQPPAPDSGQRKGRPPSAPVRPAQRGQAAAETMTRAAAQLGKRTDRPGRGGRGPPPPGAPLVRAYWAALETESPAGPATSRLPHAPSKPTDGRRLALRAERLPAGRMGSPSRGRERQRQSAARTRFQGPRPLGYPPSVCRG